MNSATQPSPADVHCHAFVVRVRDLKVSLPWYKEKLGATVTYHDQAYQLVEMRTPCGTRLCIWQIREHEKLIPASVESPYMVFLANDHQAYHRELSAKGVKVTPIQPGMGISVFWFADPDDNQYCVLHFNPE